MTSSIPPILAFMLKVDQLVHKFHGEKRTFTFDTFKVKFILISSILRKNEEFLAGF